MSKFIYNKINKNRESDTVTKLPKENRRSIGQPIKKGQIISGQVMSTGKESVINILGQDIPVLEELIEGAQIGEVKTFQVISVYKNQIELKVLDSIDDNKNKFVAHIKLNRDQDSFMLQRFQNDNKEIQEEGILNTKSHIEKVLSRLTARDIAEIEKEGIPIGSYTAESLSWLISRIKRKVKESESENNKSLTQDNYKDLNEQLEDLLRQANLPVTRESVQKLSNGLSLYESIEEADDKTIQNLLALDLPATIENIYKARHINSPATKNKLTEEDWEDLSKQVIKALEEWDIEASESNMDKAKWLIENDLPLSREKLIYYGQLEEMSQKYEDRALVLKQMVNEMKKGKDPKDTDLLQGKDYNNLIKDINSIEDNTIIRAVREKEELNINNLRILQKSIRSGAQASTIGEEVDPESIRALRHMEEIRLKMTADAALSLEKKGIHIDYEPLERFVDELRKLEENYYKGILEEAEVDTNMDNVDILRETTDRVDNLRQAPSFILGKTLDSRHIQTITSLSNEGALLHREMNRAGQAYEQLMTVPISEYGDSIHKAFANINSILAEMKLPETRANERAVRILAYNQMDITEENIENIKLYDMEVNSLLYNLHPSTTVKLIRDGVNPLNIPINELNKLIGDVQREETSGEVEKYSRYLQRLDKQGTLSPEERKSYIGIYRLLYSIKKSDGAALGALVKADGQVTLSNLLTAVRTLNKGSLDALINDDFGYLDNIDYQGEKINVQVQAAYGESGSSEANYLSQSINLIYSGLTPDHLEYINQSDQGLWEGIRDVPIEQLFDKFTQYDDSHNQEEINAERLKEIQDTLKNSDQAVEFLNNIKIPSSTVNISLANQLINNDSNLYKRLSGLEDEEVDEKLAESLKKFEEATDKVFDKEILEEAYREMEEDISQSLYNKIFTGTLDSKRLAEIKNIQMQLPFTRKLAEREIYQIPIMTEDGLSNINLTILREKEKAGRISVTMESQTLGNIRAELSLKDDHLNGYIGSDNREGLDILQNNLLGLNEAAKEGQIGLGRIDFSLITGNGFSNLNKIYSKEEIESPQSKVTERQLYLLAQGLVKTIMKLEKQ